MPAVLRTPHFTFLMLTASLPGLNVPFYHAYPLLQNALVSRICFSGPDRV